MKRISLDVWIQLIGMFSIVVSLLFVGLQMQQSQTIALASQQQARTEVLVDIIGGFDEGDKSFVDLISGIVDGSYVDDSNVVRDAIWQIWMLYENDFLQNKLQLGCTGRSVPESVQVTFISLLLVVLSFQALRTSLRSHVIVSV
mgnify:CR=1 FL=1